MEVHARLADLSTFHPRLLWDDIILSSAAILRGQRVPRLSVECVDLPLFESDQMLITVKSRGIQRGMLAEMRGDRQSARRHLLAAAHLELVLAEDYERQDEADLAFRSRLSAASCFWRAGQCESATAVFNDVVATHPERQTEVEQVLDELRRDFPAG